MVKNLFLNAENNGAMTWVFVGLLIVLVVVLLVVPMFTNKKRAKQTMELHNSLKPGDVIKTVGGVIGTIKEIRKISPVDTEMVIETGTGDNKTTMTFDIQALYQIMSRSNNTVESGSAVHDDIFDAPVKADDAHVAVDNKDDVKADVAEETVESVVEPVVEDHAEANDAPANEQAAVVEEPVAEAVEEKPATTHKPVQKKSSTGAKKSTKK